MARDIRGSYKIKPYKSASTRQQLYRVTGTTLLGERIREQGFEIREAAQVRINALIKEDTDTAEKAPIILTSRTVTSSGMLSAVETGLILLENAGYPITVPSRTEGAADDYVNLLAVKYSLANGFNPTLVSKTLADLDVLFRADIVRRKKLPRTDEDRIKMRTAVNYEKAQNRLMGLFSHDLPVTALAETKTQERLIRAANLTKHVAVTLKVNIGLMLELAKDAEWILTYECWSPPKHVPQQPKKMSLGTMPLRNS